MLWRAALTAALVCVIGLLPWLSRTDPALTVLKARSTERAPTPETLRAIREQLGLDNGPLALLWHWLGGLALLGALAVTATGGVRLPRRRRWNPSAPTPAAQRKPEAAPEPDRPAGSWPPPLPTPPPPPPADGPDSLADDR